MSPLEVFNCEQGTDEWHEVRRGIVTASEFSTVMAKGKGGGESVTRRKYLLTLAGERIAGRVEPGYSSQYTDRGKADESEALALYSLLTDNEVTQCGFMRRGDTGYSPDGLVDADNGLIEAKTKLYHLHIDALLRDEVPSDHIAQCQGGLWVSSREWIDFISYSKGLPLFAKRIYRDEVYIKRLADAVDVFVAELNETIERINRRAA